MDALAHLQRDAMPLPHQFRLKVFIVASLTAAAILVSIVAIPQWLSKQARWEVLRTHVGQIAQLAASVVDGDLHQRLLDPANYSPELYARALKPLVRFHSANPDLFYVYTMAVRNHVPHFILDTAASPDLRTTHHLRASPYMQPFTISEKYQDGWLDQIAAGHTYVTPTFEHDDYGNFLSAHVPIYDSQGGDSGFVGVDFDMQYYLAEEARFRVIEAGSLAVAVMAALLIGFLVALYYGDLRRRMRELYHRSTRDDLTGLLNRRGAKLAVDQALTTDTACCAMVLVDIDHLRMIIGMHGHSTGDAVVARTAEAIRQSIHEGEVCARLGEGEFMVFCPERDKGGALEIAERIMAALRSQEMPLADVEPAVTIGIAAYHGGNNNFSQMYRDAHAALYQAKIEGRSSIGLSAGASRKPRIDVRTTTKNESSHGRLLKL
jgi:diguanylate cyclase (GGDEF)-like protein